MKLARLYNEFFESEKAGGLILVFVTIISLVLANSAFQAGYIHMWNYSLAGHSVVHWINEGLMDIFFLLIGLELEREIRQGELSNIKNASLPIFGAIGGMFVPAGIFLVLNAGTATQSGAGIPMATDIAFAIGILSLLGNKVPVSLKIFLTALAVIDDLGAIIVIAVFYTTSISFINLSIALGILGVLIVFNHLKIKTLIPYIIGGAAAWYFMLNSGIQATITGVMLAFIIPFGDGGEKSPSYKLQHFLHKPVAFIILPLFALANTSIAIGSDWFSSLGSSGSLGIIGGLVLGKPIGIALFSFIAILLGFAVLPGDLKWKHIIGAGFLGGIGFTMSIFITLLAFDISALIDNSKIAVLIASGMAAIIGFIILKLTLRKSVPGIENSEKLN
jgi:NhaA family Na+:H+ antiporter